LASLLDSTAIPPPRATSDDRQLIKALSPISAKPLLSHEDLQDTLESTEDRFAERLADEQARMAAE